MYNEELTKKRIYWQGLINEFNQGKLNQSQFSKSKGVSVHQLSYWIRKLNKVKDVPKETSSFIKIKPTKPSRSSNIDPIWLSELIKNLHA